MDTGLSHLKNPSKTFINLPDLFYTIPLSGEWKSYRKVALKSMIVRKEGKRRAVFYVDAEHRDGSWRRARVSDLVFDDPDSLLTLAKAAITLALLLEEEKLGRMLTPREAHAMAQKPASGAVSQYPAARRAVQEEEK